MADLARVVIWGASAEAAIVADILRLRGEHVIAGFLDDVHVERTGEAFGGSRILAGPDPMGALAAQNVRDVAVAFGHNEARRRVAARLGEHGCSPLTAVHPSATVAGDVVIGPGSIVHAGAVIAVGARLGAVVIINTAASVDHGSVLEDGVHVSAGARIGAEVRVGPGTFVGMGAIVVSGCRIGAGSIVGAGSLVRHDLPEGVVAYGAPARVVRTRGPEDEP